MSLSQTGGTCLINSVPNTMTNYAMSNFLLPKNILQTINRCISKFWWGKERDTFVRFISWHKICQPKSFGGLVNKNSNIMNLVLLTKVAWRILTQPVSLLSKVYRAKYVRSNGWWSSTCIGNQSFVWKSIIKGIHILKGNVCWSIGDGKNVQIGLDPWVPGVPLFCPTINPRYACLETKKI